MSTGKRGPNFGDPGSHCQLLEEQATWDQGHKDEGTEDHQRGHWGGQVSRAEEPSQGRPTSGAVLCKREKD